MTNNPAQQRRWEILKSVVSEYIETAQPVGSSHLAQVTGLGVSPATLRNDMAALEEEGYLAQPHTSAGRVPTDKGYRFFVDQLSASDGTGELSSRQSRSVVDFFNRTHGQIEEMLRDTSSLLARLTDYTAVVVAPAHESAKIRSAQLVDLGNGNGMVVVVLSDGAVANANFDLPSEAGFEDLAHSSELISREVLGKDLRSGCRALSGLVSAPQLQDLGPVVTQILTKACGSLRESVERASDAQQVFVDGTSKMAIAFDAIETVRSVLDILEQQFVVVTLLRDVINAGLSVAIGTEHGNTSLAECSLVVAPYRVGGRDVGTIGVLGPTRMHYPQAMAAVAVVGKRLETHLNEG